jgi:hypothetical protein
VADHVFHLGQGQHARQHGALDAELVAAEIDRLVAGGRGLHRKVAAQLRVGLGRVIEHRRVGDDYRIHAQLGGLVHRCRPVGEAPCLGIGVDGDEHLAPALVGVADAFGDRLVVEVEAGEVARVGVVAKAEIDVVGAVIDRRLERRKAARRTYQLRFGHCCPSGKEGGSVMEGAGKSVD